MYGCPHCFKIIRTKKAFERHLEDCKKRDYSCELCDLKFNEPELLEIHKKSHEKSDQDIPKYEIIETVDDEDDDSDFDTDISVEEPSTGSVLCEDPDTKPENEVICDDDRALAGPSDITIKMEFSAEETKLQNLQEKQTVACTSHDSVVEQLSNNENSNLHQDASILEASTRATSLRSKIRLAGIPSNQESETDTSDETNTVDAAAFKNADESCGSENIERSINDQDSQPSDDDLSFQKKNSRKHHKKVVHDKALYECAHCAKKFRYKCRLLPHLKTHFDTLYVPKKPDKPFGILLEDTNINIKTELVLEGTTLQPQDVELRYPPRIMNGPRESRRLSKELAAVDTKKLKLCKVCSLPFPNIKRRQHHMITKHRDPQFKCSKCEKQFYYTTTLKRHELLHLKKEMGNLPQEKKTKRPPRDPLATKTCQECKAVFPSYRTKYHHMITEHTEPKYACKYCSKRFHFSACITRHLKIHEGPKANQKCSICSEQFDREEDKWQHMRKVHGTAQYRCNECSETFMNFPQMKRHLQNRHGKDWTNRRYTVIERRHRKSVPNARSPSANPSEPKDNGAQSSDYEMDYASTRGEDSETARATKTQGIVHTCKDCGEQFASSKESYYHTLKKHRDSLFKCSQCPSAFIALQNLARHEQEAHRIVLSKRVVEKTCSKCRLQFPNKSMKFKHMVAVHGATLFQCPQCPKVFIYKHTLIRHQQTAHIQQEQNLPRLTSSTLSSGIDKPDIKTVIYEKRSVENNPSIDENTMEIRIGELEIIDTVVEDTEMAGNKTDESTIEIETEEVSDTIGWSQTRMDIRNGNTCLCCELQFTTSLEAYNHMIEQHREILIMCSQCQNLFVDKESFQIHELIHHKPSKPVLERTCNICGLCFQPEAISITTWCPNTWSHCLGVRFVRNF
nr:zinc finger protein Xfin-like [Aedes albopictus]